MFHMLDQFVILSTSAESEEAAACTRDDRWHDRGWSHQQSDKEDFPESERSLMKTRK